MLKRGIKGDIISWKRRI